VDNRKRILVVDDDSMLRKVMRVVLEPHGYECVEAYDGAEALRILVREGCKFDLVILDWRMPGGMTGVVTSMFLREKCPGVPVLFTSGADIEIVEAGEFLPKPFDADQLLAAVLRNLRA
jgi:DNA-binding response OmpR family regulator